MYKNISKKIEDLKELKSLVIGGELFPLKCPKIKYLIKKGVNVFNIYGITELSCWSSCHMVKENELE